MQFRSLKPLQISPTPPLPAVATNNLYAALLRKGGGAGARRAAVEAVKRLDAFMERSGAWAFVSYLL